MLVQANHGRRERLMPSTACPVGREIGLDDVPIAVPGRAGRPRAPSGRPADAGSIIVIVATDAPLLPHQCERLAQRAGLGIARAGGSGAHSSGDLFLCFATGNRALTVADDAAAASRARSRAPSTTPGLSPLFWAVIEATEEAIVNALVAARDDDRSRRAHGPRLPHDRLREVWQRHTALSGHTRRLSSPPPRPSANPARSADRLDGGAAVVRRSPPMPLPAWRRVACRRPGLTAAACPTASLRP